MRTGSFLTPAAAGNVTVTHNLGVTPVVLILYGTVTTAFDSQRSHSCFCFGATDGTTSQCVRHSAQTGNGLAQLTDSATTADLYKQVDYTLGTYTAAWVSWNATSFVVNFSSVGASRVEVFYIVVGGAGISGKVKTWTIPTSTGNNSVAGVGFQPQLVFAACSLHGVFGNAPGNVSYQASWGAFTASGQWAQGVEAATATVPGSATRASTAQRIDAAVVSGFAPQEVKLKAHFVSMDVGGYTLNFDTVNGNNVGHGGFSVCLAGLTNVKVGSFTKNTGTAPVTQAVTGLGFQPQGLLLASWGQPHLNYTDYIYSDEAIGIGTADGANQVSGSVLNVSEARPSNASQLSEMTVFSQLTRDYSQPQSGLQSPFLVGQISSLFTMDADGFTLRHTSNVAVASEMLYVALQSVATSQQLQVGVIRNYGDLIVGGTTPVEKIVMLTSKSAFVYTPSTPTTGIFTPTSESYTGTDEQRFSIANGTDATYGAVAAWSQGKDNIRYYDGTVFGDLITSGTNHAARVLLPFNNRIVSVRPFFGGIDHKTQIRWSVNGNYADWSGLGSGTLEVVETSNQPLTGGIVLGNRCYLTRARETIELIATGSLTPVFIPEPKVSGTGCIATHSMAAGDIFAFWLGPDEVYQWDGAQLRAVGGRTYHTITAFVDYQHLDQIQAVVYEPDSQYHLVVPPYRFIYDYRRDIWDWDDTRSFQAIGRLQVADVFTGDIDHSEFTVLGDSSVQTIRDDPSVNTYLGVPIDSYFETKDYLPLQKFGREVGVSYDKYNSVYRVWFRGTPGEDIEVGVSVDKGLNYSFTAQPSTQVVTVNGNGVGIAFFDLPFGVVRLRIRSQAGSVYSISGPLQVEYQESGVMLPP
jgi:hypothetical protein